MAEKSGGSISEKIILLRYPGRAKPWERNSMVVLPPKIGNNDF
jgi:hypothetical protein